MVGEHTADKDLSTVNVECEIRTSERGDFTEQIKSCYPRADEEIVKSKASPIGLDGIQDSIESSANRNIGTDPNFTMNVDLLSRDRKSRKDRYYASDESSQDSLQRKDSKRRKRKRTNDDREERYQSEDRRDSRTEKEHSRDDRRKKKHKRDDRKERKHKRDDRRKKKHKKYDREERKHKKSKKEIRCRRHDQKRRDETDEYTSDSCGDDHIYDHDRSSRSHSKKRYRSDSDCEVFSTSVSTIERKITPTPLSAITKRIREDLRSLSNDSSNKIHSTKNNENVETEWEMQVSKAQSKVSKGVSEGSNSGSTPTSNGTIQHIIFNDDCFSDFAFEISVDVPVELKSTTLVGNESYIKHFMDEYGYISDNNSNISPVVQGLYNVLIDAMAFQCISSDSIFEVKPMPRQIKPVQSVTSVQDFVILQALTRHWDESSTCFFMEEVALAFRLAAHCILKSKLIQENSTETFKDTRIKKLLDAKRRGLVTLVRSLRGCYSLIQEKIHDIEDGCPVKNNILNFFSVPSKCPFSKAQILLLDIVPLITDGSETIGLMGNKGSNAVLENLLKLDSISLKRKMKAKGLSSLWCFNDGLIEFFIRQLLRQENDESLRTVIEKISISKSDSVAYACASEDISPQCYGAISEVWKIRRVQLERIMFISDHNFKNTMADTVLDGCTYLRETLKTMRRSSDNSDRRLALFLMELRQNDLITHMAFHFFHMIMDNDINSNQEHLHAKSVHRPENLSSVVLASLLLSGKCLEFPISLKNLIIFFNMMVQDASINVSINSPSSKPLEELVKIYELHLQSLLGFVLPLASELPYSFINEVADTFHLEQSYIGLLRDSFLDVGVTHSKVYLLDNPKLVAFATCYYASVHLRFFDISPAWTSNVSVKTKDSIIYIADYMNQVSMYFENKKKTIDVLVPIEKPSIQRLVYVLNNRRY